MALIANIKTTAAAIPTELKKKMAMIYYFFKKAGNQGNESEEKTKKNYVVNINSKCLERHILR